MSALTKKGYKFRIYPDQDQIVFLEKTFGCCRKIWNVLLAQSIEKYEVWKLDDRLEKPSISGYSLALKIKKLRKLPEYEYLSEISSKALQRTVLQLGESFSGFFKKKKGYPKFKSKHRSKASFTLQYEAGNYFQIHGYMLTIAKYKKPIKVNLHRELPSQPSQVTISKNSVGHYFASFLCDVEPKLTNGQGIVGIDLGVKTLATISNGTTFENPRHFVKAQRCLARLQRKLSNKQKGSNNKNKARIKVAKQHLKTANQRQHYLHVLSRKIVNENQVIVIEDLNVAGMTKNPNLAKHIMDAGFGMFRRMLECKAIESHWCRILIADRWYPSTQLCSCCGRKPKEKIKLGTSKWTCEFCKTVHGRDDNASYNLRNIATQNERLWKDHPGALIAVKSYRELTLW